MVKEVDGLLLLEKKRSVLRISFSNQAAALHKNVVSKVGLTELNANFSVLETRYYEIVALDRDILALKFDSEEIEEALLVEVSEADKIHVKFFSLKGMVDNLNQPTTMDYRSVVSEGDPQKHRYRLPRLELVKYNGDVSQWISFWAQFSGIDADPSLSREDKFQYLLQATVPKSRARSVVDSFPPSGDNYDKAIAALKERCGRKDLLVEYYIRELLKLVMSNGDLKLPILYDRLEAQLRALETLNVMSDTYAAILFPLVESCLPAETLKVWQRTNANVTSPKEQMDSLLDFVKAEVEAEERVAMACSTPLVVKGKGQEQLKTLVRKYEGSPTAAGLANLTMVEKCVFCKDDHNSRHCPKIRAMSTSERRQAMTQARCCFVCLGKNHISRKCSKKCGCCGGHHHQLLCFKLSGGNPSLEVVKTESDLLAVNHSLTVSSSGEVYLQTFVVTLFSETAQRQVRVLVDSGSQRSYIVSRLLGEMKYAVIGEEKLVHSLFGGSSAGLTNHQCVKVRLRSNTTGYQCNFKALNQDTIASFIPVATPADQVAHELRDLGIDLVPDMAGPIDVLIGADVAGKIWSGKREILPSGIVAVDTLFGWTLLGTRMKSDAVRSISNLATTFTMTTIAEGDVADLWKLEAIGISDPGEKENREEKRLAALNHFKETVEFVDGRYQVRLPWYDIVEDLPSNRELAQARLESTLKKMGKTETLSENYDAVFSEWMKLNVIEKTEDDGEGHYLPHRPVVKESSSTTKVRPVFDASAKIGKCPSLNECLEQGPNLIELLPDILLRFREKAIGVSADIEKAFLQISIHPEDRQYLKFLWRSDAQEQVALRHTRVVFGVTSSPFLLAAVLDHHLSSCIHDGSSEDIELLNQLLNSFYVDNLATSVSSIGEAEKLKDLASNSLAKGGFNLRGWEFSYDSNSTARSPILGLKWDRERDSLSLNMDWWETATDMGTLTKRSVLSMTQRIFDPIGFSVPATIGLKLMLQTLWEKKLGWDDPLGKDECRTFEAWRKQVKLFKHIAVQRNLGTLKNPSLHLFCDASGKAYAACVFLRSETEDGQVVVSLVQAKSRVAPLKGLTMPRLELMGVVIGARLLKSISDALGWTHVPTYAWCDSSTVLAWIQRQEEWSVFVRNRVREVRELTPQVIWRHIPGQFNPADLPSRGCSIEQLVKSRWWEGPSWLRGSEDCWPLSHCTYEEEVVSSERLKRSSVLLSTAADHSWVYQFFSKFEKIVRMIGWINRFGFNCRNRGARKRGLLSLEELKAAENTVCRLVQEEVFPSLSDKSICELRPFRDEYGVIRLQTQISERDDLKGFTTPILLPSNHPVVQRLVYDYHCRNSHVGAMTLWSLLRERFWILKGRQVTRNTVKKCVTCKRFGGKNFDVESPPLPPSRVSDAAVFEVCGVDYAGPLMLRDGQKVWVALFTCGVYRAVHLELVTSLSTDAFLMALRRFIARRGRPKILYSDNGTCFHGANNAFAALDWEKITSYSNIERIDWRFNPPSASWWGGFYERMVQTVKRLLRRSLGRASLDIEELYTALCECESFVNSRPITPSSETNQDPVALTPTCFLQDLPCSGTPDCDEVDTGSMDRRMQYRLELRQQLRERFRSEYLGSLKWTHRSSTREPRVGEIVLIGSDDVKRLDWPIGRIEEIVRGRDGNIRILQLKTARGVLTRPLQRVFPLEVEMVTSPPADEDCAEEEETQAIKDVQPTMATNVAQPEPLVTRHGRAVRAPRRLDL